MPSLTFDPTTPGFSREAALFLANASDLAYSDEPADAARAVLGLDAVTFRHRGSDTQGFVGRGADFAVLAFRGSESSEDWKTDFRALQIQHDPFTGRVHSGFSRAITATWNDVDAVLRRALAAGAAVDAEDPGIPLYITGHSLGGALATLASCRLTSDTLPAIGEAAAVRLNLRATYTFGAPRIGDTQFCRSFTRPPVYRLVNNLDIVPLVPLKGNEWLRYRDRLPSFTPAWIRTLLNQASESPIYGDVGTLVYVDDQSRLTQGGQRPDWPRSYSEQALKSLGRSFNAPTNDHAIDSYIRALSA